MEFNSQICTTMEQSKRLLAIGLKKETADMCYQIQYLDWGGVLKECTPSLEPYPPLNNDRFIPAWSLHRLLELFIEVNGNFLDWEFEISPGKLIIRRSNRMMFVWSKNVYDSIITCIEWLIKSGYFNKEYLEE